MRATSAPLPSATRRYTQKPVAPVKVAPAVAALVTAFTLVAAPMAFADVSCRLVRIADAEPALATACTADTHTATTLNRAGRQVQGNHLCLVSGCGLAAHVGCAL
jgi:hypothetical protein